MARRLPYPTNPIPRNCRECDWLRGGIAALAECAHYDCGILSVSKSFHDGHCYAREVGWEKKTKA